jgi:hypothetical protein
MKNIARVLTAAMLACIMLLQVPVFGADKTIDEAAQEVLDRFNKYDVQWIGAWESKSDYIPEYLGEGIFKQVQKNGELHLIDAGGALLNNLGKGKKWEFDYFINGFCKFRDMDTYNYGFINNKGKVIFEPSSSLTSNFSEGLCAFQDDKNDGMGYINTEGKVIIPPKFSWAEDFKNGVAKVTDKQTYGNGYINTKGEYLISPDYDWLSGYGDLVAVLKVIDTDDGVYEAYGFVDKNGKAVTDVNYCWASEPSREGLACAGNEEGKYGYFDKTGKTVIPFQYRFAGRFSDGLAFVCNEEGKFGYIDKTGKTVIPFIFDDARDFSEGLAAVYTGKNNGDSDLMYGYINKKGDLVIPMKYENAGPFHDGVAFFGAEYSQRHGIIDQTGKVLAEKKCEEFDYQDGLVKYKIYHYSTSPIADRYGYIDKNGNDMGANTVYTYLGDYKEGLSAYMKELDEQPYKNRIAGYVDQSFKCILEDKNLRTVDDFENGAAAITVYVSQGKEFRYRTGLLKNPLAALKAVATPSKIMVNGKQMAMEAYGINGNNYFKLRDLAKIVSGTRKQFEVTWDGQKKAINLVSNKPYTAVGGELAAGEGKEKSSSVNLSKVYRDGQEVYLKAYTINGNNYFKLRDVAKAFNIGITWDAATGTIGINTDSGYVD